MSKTTQGLLRGTAILAASTLLGLTLTGVATAKGGEPGDDNTAGTTTGSSIGNYAVTINGTTYDPAPGKDAKVQDLRVQGVVKVTGVHTTFTLDPATLGVYDYTL